eukprot:TRINITY_DN10977_c0_g1_i1.p3 TRINITY_DN10977_c0_g1~~TRINITY_DN10977_c0_g1_i1.p3  ORF type:complete len:108 (+),score=27.18 TRINITY_DN10977_c0_g1_i1:243-566(+)
MLEEMYASEETAKEKVLDKLSKNKSKWQREKNTLLKANKEIIKMMEHIDKQIANVKEKQCEIVTINIIFPSQLSTTSISYYVSWLSLIHICRCRRYAVCRSRWSPYH